MHTRRQCNSTCPALYCMCVHMYVLYVYLYVNDASPITSDLLAMCSLEDLRQRFEPPNESNRWDCPLFKVHMGRCQSPPPDSMHLGSAPAALLPRRIPLAQGSA